MVLAHLDDGSAGAFDYENNPIYQSGGKTDGFYVMDAT